MAFFELRQYQIKPGQMQNWVKFMDEEVIPYQVSRGMVVVGSFYGQEDENLYVWIRRFESEEERERIYAATYDNVWQEQYKPRVDTMLDREKGLNITRLEPSPLSILR